MMNVFKFNIDVCQRNVDEATDNIQNKIIKMYSCKETHDGDYSAHVSKMWKSIDKNNINVLFSETVLVSHRHISNTRYFLVGQSQAKNKDRSSFTVFVISELEDLNQAYTIVYNDIKSILCRPLKPELIEKKIYIYVHDNMDIVSLDVVISASVVNEKPFAINDIIRYSIVVLLAVIILSVAFARKGDQDFIKFVLNDNLLSGGVTSMIVMLSEIISRLFSKKKYISRA